MKTFLAAAVAVATLAVAAPASADPHRGDAYRGDQRSYQQSAYDNRGPRHQAHRFSRDDLQRLQARIDWGFRSGALTRWEARRLSWQVADLQDRARYYWRTDGLSWRERQELDERYDYLSFQIRRQIRDEDYGRGGPPGAYRR